MTTLYAAALRAGLLHEPDDILSPSEAATMLGVAASTLRGYVRRGLLRPAVNLGGAGRGARHGFRHADLVAFQKPASGRPRGGA